MEHTQSGRTTPAEEYTPSELMIVTASRALEGSRVVFVGVGLPNIACNLARRSHSPTLELVYESGIFGAHPARLPLSIGDPTLVSDATSAVGMADLFLLYLQGGLVDTALLGGAQIDRYGNLNTTVIGDYAKPKVRLPGSGGACEIATNARQVFMIMRLKRRAFVEKLDFLTSPGHLAGGDGRSRLGLPGNGPKLVITDRALFGFDQVTGEMTLMEMAAGESAESIQNEVGWPLRISPELSVMLPPSTDELRLIRQSLDPDGMYR
jgi:glutaconate CoA-transferase subunit B